VRDLWDHGDDWAQAASVTLKLQNAYGSLETVAFRETTRRRASRHPQQALSGY